MIALGVERLLVALHRLHDVQKRLSSAAAKREQLRCSLEQAVEAAAVLSRQIHRMDVICTVLISVVGQPYLNIRSDGLRPTATWLTKSKELLGMPEVLAVEVVGW